MRNDRPHTLGTARAAGNGTGRPFRPVGQHTVDGQGLERVRCGCCRRQPRTRLQARSRARVHAIVGRKEIVPIAPTATVVERYARALGGVVRVALVAAPARARFRRLRTDLLRGERIVQTVGLIRAGALLVQLDAVLAAVLFLGCQ